MHDMMFDTPEGIAFFKLAARSGALKLELAGLKRRGRSAYSICKEVYGLTGNRASVLKQMETLVEASLERRKAWTKST